jgi:hypothetical protein
MAAGRSLRRRCCPGPISSGMAHPEQGYIVNGHERLPLTWPGFWAGLCSSSPAPSRIVAREAPPPDDRAQEIVTLRPGKGPGLGLPHVMRCSQASFLPASHAGCVNDLCSRGRAESPLAGFCSTPPHINIERQRVHMANRKNRPPRKRPHSRWYSPDLPNMLYFAFRIRVRPVQEVMKVKNHAGYKCQEVEDTAIILCPVYTG